MAGVKLVSSQGSVSENLKKKTAELQTIRNQLRHSWRIICIERYEEALFCAWTLASVVRFWWSFCAPCTRKDFLRNLEGSDFLFRRENKKKRWFNRIDICRRWVVSSTNVETWIKVDLPSLFAEYSFSLCVGRLSQLWLSGSSVSHRWLVIHSVSNSPEIQNSSQSFLLSSSLWVIPALCASLWFWIFLGGIMAVFYCLHWWVMDGPSLENTHTRAQIDGFARPCEAVRH